MSNDTLFLAQNDFDTLFGHTTAPRYIQNSATQNKEGKGFAMKTGYQITREKMYCNTIEKLILRGENVKAGVELRKMRTAMKATQQEFAAMLGKKHWTSVSYWESGRQMIPESVMILLKIIENKYLQGKKKSRKKVKKDLRLI